MRARLVALSLTTILIGAAVGLAQSSQQGMGVAITQPDYSIVNCSGFYSDQKVPDDMYVISGEQSNIKLTFSRGDYVYINRGLDRGMRVGDRFSIMRPDQDPTDVQWFKWQHKLMRAMGTLYTDIGQVRVVSVQPKVSIAQVIFSCGYAQRGDIARPYEERPAPPFKDASTFDHFAPVSGKPVGMVVAGYEYTQLFGKNSAVYVNLGAAQGVKVGDYFRIFRYQGSMAETVPQTKDYQYTMYGFGTTPARYSWNDLPREILGEGVVLRVSRNSSTMMITTSTIEVYAGDYVEIE